MNRRPPRGLNVFLLQLLHHLIPRDPQTPDTLPRRILPNFAQALLKETGDQIISNT